MGDITSIQLKKSTKRKLDNLKLSEKETYHDVIENLIEDSLELSEKTLEDLKIAQKERKEGKVHSLHEIKREMGFWMVKVFLTESALKDLKKLPRVISKRIFRKLEEYQEESISIKNIKKLVSQPFYRIHVGDYRIIFELGDGEEEIYVLKISHRKNIFK